MYNDEGPYQCRRVGRIADIMTCKALQNASNGREFFLLPGLFTVVPVDWPGY